MTDLFQMKALCQFWAALLCVLGGAASAQEAEFRRVDKQRESPRPRLAVLTDIGGDPDDQQSLIRLMVYVNEFELEAILATASGTPGELKEAVTRPDLVLEIIGAYEQV